MKARATALLRWTLEWGMVGLSAFSAVLFAASGNIAALIWALIALLHMLRIRLLERDAVRYRKLIDAQHETIVFMLDETTRAAIEKLRARRVLTIAEIEKASRN